jgi:hypothetical protein
VPIEVEISAYVVQGSILIDQEKRNLRMAYTDDLVCCYKTGGVGDNEHIGVRVELSPSTDYPSLVYELRSVVFQPCDKRAGLSGTGARPLMRGLHAQEPVI